jgi:hypothetical protein
LGLGHAFYPLAINGHLQAYFSSGTYGKIISCLSLFFLSYYRTPVPGILSQSYPSLKAKIAVKLGS